jgi:hypothetical protein
MIRQVNTGFAPLSGQLKAEYVADLIALDRSPLDDISVLAEASHITHVWKSGTLYKHPEGGICGEVSQLSKEVLGAFVPRSDDW